MSPDNQQPKKTNKINWSGIKELIKKIPWVGEPAILLFEWIGCPGLVGALVTACLISLSLYFHWLPETIVNPLTENYTKITYKTRKNNFSFQDIANETFMQKYGYLEPYKKWVEDEAIPGKQALYCHCQTNNFSDNYENFNLVIEAAPSFEISANAFLITKNTFMKKLDKTKLSTIQKNHTSSTTFEVPKSKKSDKIILVFSVIGTKSKPQGICTNFFQNSIVKK